MLKPSDLRSLAADLEDIALRVEDSRDSRVLDEVAAELLIEADKQDVREAALRELTKLSQKYKGGYR